MTGSITGTPASTNGRSRFVISSTDVAGSPATCQGTRRVIFALAALNPPAYE
jgi:hypothetical protein